MSNKEKTKFYCDYCQEQNLKDYIINSLGAVFCNDYCHDQMKQFYKGNYKIVERKTKGEE